MHPIPAAFLVVVLAAVAIGHATRGSAMRLFTHCALAGVVGAALSAPYWYPLLRLHDTVHLERVATGYFTASRHLVGGLHGRPV